MGKLLQNVFAEKDFMIIKMKTASNVILIGYCFKLKLKFL